MEMEQKLTSHVHLCLADSCERLQGLQDVGKEKVHPISDDVAADVVALDVLNQEGYKTVLCKLGVLA